jgi:hypothetical protein
MLNLCVFDIVMAGFLWIKISFIGTLHREILYGTLYVEIINLKAEEYASLHNLKIIAENNS